MISEETLKHKPTPISLGWLDDSMTMQGMTEGAPYPTWVIDTGSSPQDMQDHVAAYHANIARLQRKVVSMGGFYWQMIKGRGPQVRPTVAHGKRPAHNVTTEQCIKILSSPQYCAPDSSHGGVPLAWKYAQLYQVQPSEAINEAESITAEFLLTRGPFAWVGYGWVGCSAEERPRPAAWDVDYGGEAAKPCYAVTGKNGVFRREYTKATVEWDCNSGRGHITMK